MTNAVTVTAQAAGAVNFPVAVTGTVSPATDVISLQLALQNTTAPTGAWVSATTSNGTFAGTLIPPAGGNWYAWAWDQATGIYAVSGVIAVPSPAASLVAAFPLSVQQAQDLLGTTAAGETPDELTIAAAASDTDTAVVAQGGKVLFAQPFSAIWTYVANKILAQLWPQLTITTNTALDNAAHNGRVLVVTAGGVTLSLVAGSIGAGFNCTVINASGSTVALSGIGSNTGATTIAAGNVVDLWGYSTTGGVAVIAKL